MYSRHFLSTKTTAPQVIACCLARAGIVYRYDWHRYISLKRIYTDTDYRYCAL